jgi:GT2 family glycosyltransferase
MPARQPAGTEPETVVAPPVVAVMVVHAPGAWFEETLDSLARQDYPNLNTFFLLTASPQRTGHGELTDAEIAEHISAVLPNAFIEQLGANPGFSAAANSVLDFVEGDNGFFCICHDDVALAPDAIRLMVEELYRSNAGIIGPKLVSWDDARLLQNVGIDVDRFGQPAPRVEQGEYDQEQHDAVTDVFAVPSACLLTRADLFRSLGGFDRTMPFHGEDVDLCWRAHISGARVMVAPGARVRHREELELRRPDLNHNLLRSRHRLRSMLTLTAGARLPLRLVELIGLTLVEMVFGIFAGRFGEAWASVRAAVGSIARFPTLLARRGAIAKIRNVSDAEVHGLQSRGSNRLRSFGRARDVQMFIGVEDNIRRWRERSLAPLVTWGLVVVAVIVASRSFINGSVPSIGEFLRFPDSPRQLWRDYTSAWNPSGFGSTSPNPTGLAVVSAASVFWLFHMGLGLTMTVVGLVLLGGLGVWRLAGLFPSNRERTVALIAYVTMPLLPGVISTGRLSSLVAFAAVPWFVHLVRVAIGIGTADPASESADLADGIREPSLRERTRRTAIAGIVVALAVAVAPPVILVIVAVTLVLGLTTLLVGAGWRTAGWLCGSGLVACGIAWLLNVPASTSWSWNDLTAVPLAGANGRGLSEVASMNIGEAKLGLLALALYVPVIAGLALSRAWRLTWAARAAGLVTVFLGLAVLQDRDSLPFRVPDIGILLVPVALGLALSAACAVSSFASDVAGGSFGWRQPLGLLSIAAVACGVFPAMITLTDGAWYAPRTSFNDLVAPQIAPDPTGDGSDLGSFRVLYVGDPRLIPVSPEDIRGGLSIGLTGPGMPQFRDRFAAPDTPADSQLQVALHEIATGSTQRGGRLLAPYGIRFVVVPIFDGAESTPDDPIEPPIGLVDALNVQLDLELAYTATDFMLYENRSAIPAAAMLSGDNAAAIAYDTPAQLARVNLSDAPSLFGDILQSRRGTGEVEPGVVHLSVPFDDDWTLQVGDQEIAPHPGFGVLTAYDTPAAGAAELAYEAPSSRRTALIGQALLWALALLAASRLSVPSWLGRFRRPPRVQSATVLDLDDDHAALPTEAGEIPILVPLEFTGPPAEQPTSVVAAVRRAEEREAPTTSLFGDDRPAASWVDDLLDEEDER